MMERERGMGGSKQTFHMDDAGRSEKHDVCVAVTALAAG
jgi:hypothetical protein